MILAIIAIIWVICGVLVYGALRAFFWNEFRLLQDEPGRRTEVTMRGFMFGLAGPISLIALFVMGCFSHGFNFGELK